MSQYIYSHDIAKSRQWHDIKPNNFLLHVPNPALKGLNSTYYDSMT